jgi:hypothetical protein
LCSGEESSSRRECSGEGIESKGESIARDRKFANEGIERSIAEVLRDESSMPEALRSGSLAVCALDGRQERQTEHCGIVMKWDTPYDEDPQKPGIRSEFRDRSESLRSVVCTIPYISRSHDCRIDKETHTAIEER